tara:strand:- start:5 stop:478 length:474 start_codon:yes stop_codon:yes gene_type:complete
MNSKTQEFLQKLKDIGHWNDDLDYSEVEYINHKTRVKVICTIHGAFFPVASKLTSRGAVCLNCHREAMSKRFKSNKETFLYKLKTKGPWNNNYDFSEFDYINANTKSKIICKKHGEFFQTPSALKNGSGCKFCSGKLQTQKQVIQEKKYLEVLFSSK